MANTLSAKKAVRQSIKKKSHNLLWKRKIKASEKRIAAILATKPENTDILKQELSLLQKVVDKAVKNEVIKANNGRRIKSRYAKKASAQASKPAKSTKAPTARKAK